MILKKICIPILLLTVFLSCGSDDTDKSSTKKIISFSVENKFASINEEEKSVYLTLPGKTKLNSISPVIEVSSKASIYPGSGEEQDFSDPVIYTVHAEDGSTQQYMVFITLEMSSSADILEFHIGESQGVIEDDRSQSNPITPNHIIVDLQGVTDVTKLRPTVRVSSGAEVVPASGTEIDFSRPVTYTVTAENDDINSYTVAVRYDTYPAGFLCITKIRNTNRTNDITTHCDFIYDHDGVLKSFTRTTDPFYIDDVLVEGDIINYRI